MLNYLVAIFTLSWSMPCSPQLNVQWGHRTAIWAMGFFAVGAYQAPSSLLGILFIPHGDGIVLAAFETLVVLTTLRLAKTLGNRHSWLRKSCAFPHNESGSQGGKRHHRYPKVAHRIFGSRTFYSLLLIGVVILLSGSGAPSLSRMEEYCAIRKTNVVAAGKNVFDRTGPSHWGSRRRDGGVFYAHYLVYSPLTCSFQWSASMSGLP
jgi:hypothetical protein